MGLGGYTDDQTPTTYFGAVYYRNAKIIEIEFGLVEKICNALQILQLKVLKQPLYSILNWESKFAEGLSCYNKTIL